jgi:hypothetical protein
MFVAQFQVVSAVHRQGARRDNISGVSTQPIHQSANVAGLPQKTLPLMFFSSAQNQTTISFS